jgi:hypothetical protein
LNNVFTDSYLILLYQAKQKRAILASNPQRDNLL